MELYEKIEERIENINQTYSSTRSELCKPKIYDISDSNYNYNNIMKSESNKANDLRLGYLKDIDNVLSNFFQDGISDSSFKDAIDEDINKTIQYFGESKLLVGKISLKYKNENLIKMSKNSIKKNIDGKTDKQALPIYLSEKALKVLNKSFMC